MSSQGSAPSVKEHDRGKVERGQSSCLRGGSGSGFRKAWAHSLHSDFTFLAMATFVIKGTDVARIG